MYNQNPHYIVPFQDLMQQTQQHPAPQSTLIQPSLDELNKTFFKNKLASNQLNEYELASLIKNNIETMADDILGGDQFYSPYLMNPSFVKAFIRAISSIPIGYKERLLCNKIVYDYFTFDNPDRSLKEQYLSMARIVNQDIIHRLQSIGVDENTACNLALARYSSKNEKTNVKRLNFVIYHKDPEIMTEQRVVWIYEKLFAPHMNDLFQATMFEVYPPIQQQEFGENFMEVYGVVGLAVLCILNNMKSDDIRRILIGYHSEWEYKGHPEVRFGLRSLSEDYSRIARMVEMLHQQGIDIP